MDPNWTERVLWAEIEPLFDAAIDTERFGYVPDLDADWRPSPGGDKSLVFHARMLWAASELVRTRGDRAAWLAAHAERAAAALLDVFRDPARGGFHWLVTADGARLENEGKHLYGQAFAIFSLANASRTGLEHADRWLTAAVESFDWLEAVAWQSDGYAEPLDVDGLVPNPPFVGALDAISTPFGMRSLNGHLHALEACAELIRAGGPDRVRDRLRVLLHLLRDRLVGHDGSVHAIYAPDWTPMPSLSSYGHDLELAFLLIDAAETLGDLDERRASWRVADRIARHATTFGFDAEHGGLFSEGPASRPALVRDKIWWAQAEAMNTLDLLVSARPDDVDPLLDADRKRLTNALEGVQRFANGHLVDYVRGGWWWGTDASGEVRKHGGVKASNWKSCYHTTRCLSLVASRHGTGA